MDKKFRFSSYFSINWKMHCFERTKFIISVYVTILYVLLFTISCHCDTDREISNEVKTNCTFRLVIPQGCRSGSIDPISNTSSTSLVDLTVLNFQFIENELILNETNNTIINGEGAQSYCEFNELEEFPANCIVQNKSFHFRDHVQCLQPNVVSFDAKSLWIEDTTYSTTNISYRRDTTGLVMECHSSEYIELRTDSKIQFSGIGVRLGQKQEITFRNDSFDLNQIQYYLESIKKDTIPFKKNNIYWMEMQIPKNLKSGTLEGYTGNYSLHVSRNQQDKKGAVVKNYRIVTNSVDSIEPRSGDNQFLKLDFAHPEGGRCYASSNENLYLAAIGGENPVETRLLSKCLEKDIQCELKSVGKLCFQNRACATLNRRDMTPNGILLCSNAEGNLTQEYFTDLTVSIFNQEDPHNVASDVLIKMQKDDGKPIALIEDDYDYDDDGNQMPKPMEIMTVYEKQLIKFECHYVPYILVPPIIWSIRFRNQKVIQVNTTDLNSSALEEELLQSALVPGEPKVYSSIIKSAKYGFYIEKDIIEISCKASFWDSSKIINSSINLNVLTSNTPKFSEDSKIRKPVMVEGGQDFNLTCQSEEASPPPVYEWELNGRVINSNENCIKIIDDPSTGSSHLTACNAAKSHVGIYTCRARNFIGSDERTFSVFVTQLQSNAWIYFGIACSFILLLLPSLVFMYRMYLSQRSRLTELEIAAFIHGDEKAVKKNRMAHENAQFLPYNQDYEVEWKSFETDDDVLGEGAYGIVLKGKIDGKLVAAKTVRPTSEKSAVLALLSELKIMIYLEKHNNIVELIGACTSMLKEGKPYVFVEFCENGDLHSYLQACRTHFEDHFNQNQFGCDKNVKGTENDSKAIFANEAECESSFGNDIKITINTRNSVKNDYENTKEGDCEKANNIRKASTQDLFKWSSDIASGMEYLELKKVIHGDLAARNILVTGSRNVKITDFGLSRQLQNNYTKYVKKHQALLPWRWMAIESLSDMIFTSKSDVWAFGVTIWELFTLAQLPYPGLAYTMGFVDDIKNNLRLPKPLYGNDQIYKILTDCWKNNPEDRPSFTELKSAFGYINPMAKGTDYLLLESCL